MLRRDDAEDGAPPRSRVDLDAGIARLVIPRDGDARPPSGREGDRS
jgi:hypothetical protein